MHRPEGLRKGAEPGYGSAPLRVTGQLRRGPLLAALDEGAWLTALVAGPGAGKTALLANWTADRPVAWLTLRPEHAALPVLRGALANALRTGRSPSSAVIDGIADEGRAGPVEDEQAQAAGLASALAAAFDWPGLDPPGAAGQVRIPDQRRRGEATGELPVILDDLHHLPPGSPAIRLVEELCRHAPGGLRLIVASRTELPFAVDRLRAAGRLTELTEARLAFAEFETYQLLTLALGDATAADTLAAHLHRLTGGRPGLVALGAAWLAAQPAATRRDRLVAIAGRSSALADYLAGEVLAGAEPQALELARWVAHLPGVDAELCRSLGLVGSTALLTAVPGQPGWYTVDSALRAAVVATAPLPEGDRQKLLAGALAWYAAHDRLDDALAAAHALLGEPPAEPIAAGPVVDLLTTHGPALLSRGRAAEVVAAATRVPADLRTLELDLVEGEARHLRGDRAGALACLERSTTGDGGLDVRAAYRIGLIRQAAGDPSAALASYRRARLAGAAPADAALLHGHVALVHWLRNELLECRAAAQLAQEAAHAAAGGPDADRALAAAHTALAIAAERDGDLTSYASHMTEAMAAAVRAGDLVQQIRLRVNRSGRLLEEGRNADALVELDEAMRLIEATGAMDRYAVARTNRGWAYRAMGRLDEAVAELQAASRAWRDAGSAMLAYSLTGLGSVYLVRGDLAQAEGVLTEAVAIGDRTGDHQALAGLSTLARVRYAADPESGRELAERSIVAGVGVWRGWALLTAGWVAMHDGDVAAAARYADAAEAAATARRDPTALAEIAELRGLLAYDAGDRPTSLAHLRDAQSRWSRLGNPIFVARVGVLLAAASGGDIPAAEARLRALGVRPEVARAAGPLRAVNAFAAGVPAFLPTARAGLDRLALGDLGGARRLLADALDGVRGRPAGGEIRATYLDALRALGTASAAAGETEVALRWYLRLLELDPDDEAGNLGAVIALARAGRHDESRRRYRSYTDRMRAVGAEPAPYPSEWTVS